MKSFTLVAALVAVIPATLGLTINSPDGITECEPTKFTFSDGVAPYYLSFVPAAQPSATPIEQIPAQNDTSYTWYVDLAAGTSFTAVLKDGTGGIAYTSILTVEAGASSSCVNGSSPQTGTTAGGSGSSGTPTTGGSVATTTGSTKQTTSPAGSSSTPTSGASSSHSNGAGRLGVSSAIGVAGVMGLVGAALF